MKPGNVPTERIAPILHTLIRERWPHGGGIDVLSEKVGCDWGAISHIIDQKNEGVEFDLADRLICALGRWDMWHGELADIYPEKFLETCALPSCGRRFPESNRSGRVKRYCSDNCRSLAGKTRAGRGTGQRFVQRGRCFKGHRMTPDNTQTTRQRDGSTRKQCRTCRRISVAAYKRKQRRENRSETNRKQREYRARRKFAHAT